MKAKYYIGILSILLLTFSTVKAQRADSRDYSNDDAKLVVNNYYNDYDYYFSSRINRFHRSYAAFDYYSPVFTDSYWYNYQPFSWGLSIYGGGGFGLGYSNNYPGYDYGYGNYYGYDPYFGSNYYGGYDPFYYNSWYSPVIFNFNFGNRWHNNYYGWNGHNHYGYNNYRSVYYAHNNYHNNNYYNNNYYSNRSSSSSYSHQEESRQQF